MRQVGVLEAKTTFSALLAEVEETGEPIAITRHGKRIARLTRDVDSTDYVNPARRMGRKAWNQFLDEVWARQDAEVAANPGLGEPYDLRADRDAIE